MALSVTLAELMGLRHAGPAGWVAGAAWVAASGLSVALFVRAVRRPGRPGGELPTATLGSLGVGLAACALLVADARRRMLAIALGLEDPALSPPAQMPLRWFGAGEITATTLFVGGAGLAFCASLLALAAIVSAARAEGRLRGAPRRLAIVLVVTCLAAVMGLAATRVSTASAPLWTEQARILADARPHVVAVAAIGWVAGAWASRDSGERRFGRGAALGAVALLALGLAAFAATRGMAHDAHHPIPSDRLEHLGCPVTALDAQSLPVVARGEPLVEGSFVELRQGEALLDGAPSTLRSPADLDERLRRRRDLWLQVTRRPASEMLPVEVVAPALLGTEDIATWLRAIEAHLDRGLVLVAVEPERRFSTHTLGELAGTPHCGGIPVRLDPEGRALTSYPTWGDLVREHDAGSAPLGLRLR